MTGNKSKKTGSKGEEIAAKYLNSKGYDIKKKNFHFGKTGEIDIIAENNGTLVFIEVKSRKNEKYGDPLLSITYGKQKSIRKVAQGYLYVNKIDDMECRFDVITVDLSKNPPEVNHMENAF